MNTVEETSVDATLETSSCGQPQETVPLTKPEISGFDSGTRPIWSEPSLYLSIAVIFIVSLVSLSNTPLVFWLSFISMSALAVIFHLVAERILFKSKKEHHGFEAPFEGVFVVTFGAILPGLGLLTYGAYSVSSSFQHDALGELAKIAVLVVVPVFNFVVWSAVRKGYLTRPRLIGLMNGLAVGLSVSWTAIWIKCLLVPSDASCKFGWMLLLCASPFLLFAAACLSMDLWHKTESRMRRITTTFAILGGVLSFLLVFTPMVRSFSLQFLLSDAKQGSLPQQSKAVSVLRQIATPDELVASTSQVSGFTLSELLIPNRGLQAASDTDRDLFFKLTGKPYPDSAGTGSNDSPEELSSISRQSIGPTTPGLSLAKSQISGIIDAATLSSSIDWTLTFHNSNSVPEEARGEISLPAGAVVSRATLWIDGQPREAAFASTQRTSAAYQSVVGAQRDPLLVTMNPQGRVLIQCFPVPVDGGNMKIRLGFKVPLEGKDGRSCSMELPRLVHTNFAQPKRHRLSLVSRDALSKDVPGIVATSIGDGYSINGIVKSDKSGAPAILSVQRTTPFRNFATPDWFSSNQRYIVEELSEVKVPAPKRVFVVIDSSASLKDDAAAIERAVVGIPARLKPSIVVVAEQNNQDAPETEPSVKLITLDEAKVALRPESFVGGQDNESSLREVLETAAEQPSSAVLWIHGPQPLRRKLAESTPLDLVHDVSLYDWQVRPGQVSTLQTLRAQDIANQLTCVPVEHSTIDQDIKGLAAQWEHGTTKLALQRRLVNERPQATIVSDRDISAQVTSLWAREEVARLLERGNKQLARAVAEKYRLVTPVTGAVVMEKPADYVKWQLDPGHYVDRSTPSGNFVGLIGAPVDPRYGQSNEVGTLADYGYDTARDVSRLLTLASLLLSVIVATLFLRSRLEITMPAVAKAVGLVVGVPFVVHLLGTFMINNFGGLGGGL